MDKTLAALKSDIEQLSEKVIKPAAKGNVSVRYTSNAENTPFVSDNLFLIRTVNFSKEFIRTLMKQQVTKL